MYGKAERPDGLQPTMDLDSGSVPAGDAPNTSIVKAGHNCWKLAHAGRASVLVDAACYFSALEAALREARRSIFILGWDFDGRIRLRPDVPEHQSPPLGPLLRSLVESNDALVVHILIWSASVVHAPGSTAQMLLGADWQNHPRLKIKLDTRHPVYAAHHQKIVTVDDAVAFSGGIDLTVRRWDTSDHAVENPARRDPDGRHYPPVHDVQMAVDGEAARSLSLLARDRWRFATGNAADGHEPVPQLWPHPIEPHFTDTPVAIARTSPGYGGQPQISEAAQLTIDALAAARRSIYIEAQYMTSFRLGEVLVRHLENPAGPEMVLVMAHRPRGFFERLAMNANRDRLIRRLKRADRHDRLRILYPCVPGVDGTRQVLIHSKVIIVDDVFLRVGSSNLNNRSIGLDTECDLAVEATDEAGRQAITRLRDSLFAEHMGTNAEAVSCAVSEENGSVVRAIERLNGHSRGLKSFEAMHDHGQDSPVFGTALLDPDRPYRFFPWGR